MFLTLLILAVWSCGKLVTWEVRIYGQAHKKIYYSSMAEKFESNVAGSEVCILIKDSDFLLSCVCDKIPFQFWQETTTLFNSIPSTALRRTFYLGLHQIYNAMKINCQILNLNNPGNIWWGARGWWTWENTSCGTGNIWGPRWHGWKPTVFKTIAVWRRWWNLWSTWTGRPRDVRSARGVRYNEMINWVVHTSFDWCWNNCRS